MSSRKRTSPGLICLEHRIEDDEHLSHAGGNGDEMVLACCDQALVERFYGWIAAQGGNGWHIQRRSYCGAAAGGVALAALPPRVPGKRSQTDERADLFTTEGSEFGNADQQSASGGWTNAIKAFQQIQPRLVNRSGFEPLIDLPIENLQTLVEKR